MSIECIAVGADKVTMTVAVNSVTADRPLCQRPSTRVHSHYQRAVADLPISGREVAVVVQVRPVILFLTARWTQHSYEADKRLSLFLRKRCIT